MEDFSKFSQKINLQEIIWKLLEFKTKLRAVSGAFWVAELQVRQVKIGRKSCFGNFFEEIKFVK